MVRITWKKLGLAAVRAYRRAISYFNGSTSYAEFTDDIVLSGDFELEVDFFTSNVVGERAILGNKSINSLLSVISDKRLKLVADGGQVFAVGAISFTSTNEAVIRSVSGTLTAVLNGSSIYSGAFAGTITLNLIGDSVASPLRDFEGNISNLKIWTGGDRTTGTQLVNMPMGEYRKDLDGRLVYHNYAQSDDWYLNLLTGTGKINLNSVVLSGDFSISIVVLPISTNGTVIGFSDGSSVYYESGNLVFRVKNSTDTFEYRSGPPFSAGQYLNITLTKNGNDFQLYSNGSTSGAKTITPKPSYTFSAVGGANPYATNAIFNNLSATNNGVSVQNYAINDFSNVIANTANPLGANVWDNNSSVVTGSATQTSGQYSLPANSDSVYFTESSSTGLGYICTVDVVLGDISDLDAGLSSVQNTGWQPVRDSLNQPVPNKFYTLANNTINDNLTLTKTGTNPLVINNVKFQRAIDYGVLNGTEGTDYEWKNAAPEAIGYNITTERVD